MTTIVFFAQKNQGLAPSFCYRGHILFLTHLSNSENRKTKVQYMKQFLCSFNCKNKIESNKIKTSRIMIKRYSTKQLRCCFVQ